MLTIGSLFSGIGGLELGLERTGGFRTVWNCEIEAYPSAVLRKHWPDTPNLGDITKVNWSEVEKPDVICGGFPCQDISVAGRGAGIKEGTRSGLWSEFARAIRELRPKYVVVENVAILARRGLVRVLGDIAALGYDAEWLTLRASDVGAPHRRERLFIIATESQEYKDGSPLITAHVDDEPRAGTSPQEHASKGRQPPLGGLDALPPAHAAGERRGEGGDNREAGRVLPTLVGQVAQAEQAGDRRLAGPHENPDATDLQGERLGDEHHCEDDGKTTGESNAAGHPIEGDVFACFRGITEVRQLFNNSDLPEPLVRGNDDGLPKGLDGYLRRERTKALGNAVVPQVAQVIGEMILKKEEK